jgi:hypothetical protein
MIQSVHLLGYAETIYVVSEYIIKLALQSYVNFLKMQKEMIKKRCQRHGVLS